MENFSEIWNLIVKSNTFNFILFVLIFAVIFKKINISEIISSMQAAIIKLIEAARSARDEAFKSLKESENSARFVGGEVAKIMMESENTAKALEEKIRTDAEKQVENIASNAEKLIIAEERLIKNSLSRKAALASMEIAKQHIVSVLENNQNLHEKFINESIDALDRLSL